MMTESTWKKIVSRLRLGVVLITLSALTVSGASAANRLFGGYQVAETEEQKAVDQVEMTPAPGEAAEDTAGERSGQTDGEPVAWIQAPLLLRTGSSTAKPITVCKADRPGETIRSHEVGHRSPFSSISHVSSTLARQFTLVGAKPSGTG
jgi:hypothetical protein